jgi:putative nucleotidyltransferase with HDIG domain
LKTKEKSNIAFSLVISLIPCLVTITTANIGMYNSDTNFLMLLGKNGILVLILASLVYYFLNYNSDIVIKRQKLILYITIYAITAIPSLLMINLNYLVMPIIVCSMLVSAMLDTRLGIVTNLFIVLLISVAGDFDIKFILFYTISGTLASLLILKAKKRNMIFHITIYMIVINILIIYLVNLSLYGNIKLINFNDLMYAVLNASFSVIITIGSLPLWETIFNINTSYKLLDFTYSDQELLKRLLNEAPGTYHHSLMVSNLAEMATNDIGGNTLLAKTGALYHDIGKLKDPIYFIENQDEDNPHDDLDSISSAKIIINHIEYGIKIANEYKLPKQIKNIIKQHHGDTIVKYFYYKSKEQGSDNTNEDDFKYPGPKPQTNEAAIVMLADCVEAYVSSLDNSKKNMDTIKEGIDEIITDKFQEGQLKECDLKIKDLSIISDSFIKVYNGKFHERIKYPDDKTK